jgi:hypothetical protein
MTQFSPDDIRKASVSPRWAALTQLGGVAADLHNYDRFLLREPRLLVPIDVQALVVRAGVNDGETMVSLPFRDTETMPPLDVHDPGAKRPEGVHLLWCVPAALGHGKLVDDPLAPGDLTRRRLDLPVLPDRWVVLRFAVPAGAREPLVAGWVIEADAATVTPLADWPATRTNTKTVGTAVPLAQLNMHVGGTSWTQCYDAAVGRLSLHDPLADLAGIELEGDTVGYLVAGWWSGSADDPLDGIGSEIAYAQRLHELGWNDPDHPSPDTSRRDEADARLRVKTTFGLASPTRYTQELLLGTGHAPGSVLASGSVAPVAKPLNPAVSGFLHESLAAALLPPAPTRSTLLHGRLHGVPLRGGLAPENRPGKDALRVVLGSTIPDLAATLSVAGAGLPTADEDARRAAERLLAAFSAGLMMRLGEADAWSDIEEYEHAHTFGSLPGGVEGVDRFVDKPSSSTDPGSGFRAGKVHTPRPPATVHPEATVLWSAVARPSAVSALSLSEISVSKRARVFDGLVNAVPPAPKAQVREVPKSAPRFHLPAAPVLAVAGGGRALTAVEREEANGKLMCRLSDQVSQGHYGVLAATALLTSVGSAAVPDEVLDLAREALAEDPYLASWRARRAADDRGFDSSIVASRFIAESALSYSYYAADNDRIATYTGASITSAASRQRATEGLLRLSVSQGTWAHPEGVTMWGQPWRPMFCDWEISLELGPLPGWDLEGTDLDPLATVTTPDSLVLTGRSPLLNGAAGTLASGIDRWLTEERQRDLGGHGLADPQTEAALAGLRDTLSRLDLMSVALDGVREQLLGLSYDRGLVHTDANALPDGTRRALVTALPRLFAAGRLKVTSARLVDAFGRLLELPLDALLVPARVADTDPGVLRFRPRLTTPSRWRFDLVDATSNSVDAALGNVDQADLSKQLNPVAGFLLPDHMDESLEVFATDGRPLGELLHDPFSDAVTWEIAPGRADVAPAAGPTDDPDTTHHRIGWIAAGLVAADATARQGTPERRETESALSVLLRAIDTTLWTVDPFGSMGKEHIAGLVGRPIAVVAARLSLDVYSDVTDRVYGDDALRTGREAAYQSLAELQLPVRLGEITRSDDGLLGYFVDDDYAHFHLVDKVIATEALPSGRCRGVLADGPPSDDPDPIDHPYVDPSGVLRIHPGQTVRLTLLMHPGGKVYLTSGILPRTSRALARDWVDPGLKVLAPSLRCGPLLIDADKVRLPKVASFPAEQLFTHRDTPTSWKDDPILAATQSALLPDQAPEVQEGWVRIAPNPPAPNAPTPQGGTP